jgi:hypothetical protein
MAGIQTVGDYGSMILSIVAFRNWTSASNIQTTVSSSWCHKSHSVRN